MENSESGLWVDGAAAALAEAEAARDSMARRLELPNGFHASMGAAIAVQIGTLAPALVRGGAWLWPALIGIAVFVAVAVTQLVRVRRRSGVWIGGLASQVVGGTATAASVAYAAALTGAIWSSYAGLWWLVAPCAVLGGVGYALSGRYWVQRYRREPGRLGRGDPALALAAVVVLGAAGLALLIAGR